MHEFLVYKCVYIWTEYKIIEKHMKKTLFTDVNEEVAKEIIEKLDSLNKGVRVLKVDDHEEMDFICDRRLEALSQ